MPQNWKMKDTTKKKIDIYSCVLILCVTQLRTEHQMCDPDWTGHLQEKLIKKISWQKLSELWKF